MKPSVRGSASTTGLQIALHATRSPVALKNFVSLHQLINQVVKGVTGSSFRRSLLFYSPRTLSKVSLRCAASQLDMPSTLGWLVTKSRLNIL